MAEGRASEAGPRQVFARIIGGHGDDHQVGLQMGGREGRWHYLITDSEGVEIDRRWASGAFPLSDALAREGMLLMEVRGAAR